MFKKLLETPLRIASLSAYQHALMFTANAEQSLAALKRDNWTCCKCGVHLPGLMEVHHPKGHRASAATDLKAICQFCHDLEHAVWSFGQYWFTDAIADNLDDQAIERMEHRVVFIHAPDLTQIEVTRLAWACMMPGSSNLDTDPFHDAISARVDRAQDVLNCEMPRAVTEALFSLADSQGMQIALQAADALDREIRVFPGCVFYQRGVMRWQPQGFKSAGTSEIEQFIAKNDPPVEKLIEAASALLT